MTGLHPSDLLGVVVVLLVLALLVWANLRRNTSVRQFKRNRRDRLARIDARGRP